MISYKDLTLSSLITLLQSSNLDYEAYSAVREQPAFKTFRYFQVSLWQEMAWGGRTLVQKTTVRVRPEVGECDCTCSMFYLSKSQKLCWHAALVLYKEQFYLDYEKQLLEQAAGGDPKLAEKLIELRQRYQNTAWNRHLTGRESC